MVETFRSRHSTAPASPTKKKVARAATTSPPRKTASSTSPAKSRKSTKQIQVAQAINRPPVRASKRFSSWTPEQGSSSLTTGAQEVRTVALAAFSEGTQRNYSTALARWHSYCDENNVTEQDRAPAAQHRVEHWIASNAAKLSGSYLSDWISGLKAWHTINDIPWIADDRRLDVIRRGVRNLEPAPRPAREPMTIEWLNAAVRVADKSDPAEIACIAAAATGFWGLCRLGELVVDGAGFSPRRNISRADVKSSVSFGNVASMSLRFPKTKVNPQGEVVVLAHQPEECGPHRLLKQHFEQAPTEDPANTALFAYRDLKAPRLIPLTRVKFLGTMESIAQRARLPMLHGHSMRIGGCTTLLMRGVPPDRVQLHGRWSGDTFRRYIRNHAEAMAPYLAVNQVAYTRLRERFPEGWPRTTRDAP